MPSCGKAVVIFASMGVGGNLTEETAEFSAKGERYKIHGLNNTVNVDGTKRCCFVASNGGMAT